ncbi:MAG: hypothetical protein WB822_13765 [Rhodoplanes sp.]
MISLSAVTSLLSLSAALVATWVMQATTHQAGLGTSSARLALAQRIELAALAIFLVLDAVTPFITPDPGSRICRSRSRSWPLRLLVLIGPERMDTIGGADGHYFRR